MHITCKAGTNAPGKHLGLSPIMPDLSLFPRKSTPYSPLKWSNTSPSCWVEQVHQEGTHRGNTLIRALQPFTWLPEEKLRLPATCRIKPCLQKAFLLLPQFTFLASPSSPQGSSSHPELSPCPQELNSTTPHPYTASSSLLCKECLLTCLCLVNSYRSLNTQMGNAIQFSE